MGNWQIKILKFLGISALICLFSGICFAVYSYYFTLKIVEEYKVAELQANLEDQRTFLQSENSLEEGAVIQEQDLKSLFLSSKSVRDYSRWLNELTENKKLKKISKYSYFVKESFLIPNLKRNQCTEYRCYQASLPFKEIPSIIWRGLIGIEDLRFLEHKGIDFKSIIRAIIVDLKSMRLVQGGSTLTQQLVKNLFLTNERKFSRKYREVLLSIYIENTLSKPEILTAYFNSVFWGVLQGVKIKGIHSASLFYFEKKSSYLSPYEMAILVSLLKGPNYYHPLRNEERLKKRVDLIFDKLGELKLLSSREMKQKWNSRRWSTWIKSLRSKDELKPQAELWRASLDDHPLLNNYEFFILSRSFNNLLRKREKLGKEDIALKVFISDPFCTSDCNDFTYYSKFQRKKTSAIEEEKHQVGSILKPVLYSIYTSNGIKLEDSVSLESLTLKLKSGNWSPRESKYKKEDITYEEALLKSRNRPVIKAAKQIGFDVIEEQLQAYLPDLKKPLAEYPSQLLGAVELSLKDVTRVYSQFIRQECLKTQLNNGKKTVLEVLSDHTRSTIRNFIKPSLKSFAFFGKTGTTNQGLDNWFVAYDGTYLYIFWFGMEGSREGKKLLTSGASTAFQVFQEFLLNRGKRIYEMSCPE